MFPKQQVSGYSRGLYTPDVFVCLFVLVEIIHAHSSNCCLDIISQRMPVSHCKKSELFIFQIKADFLKIGGLDGLVRKSLPL